MLEVRGNAYGKTEFAGIIIHSTAGDQREDIPAGDRVDDLLTGQGIHSWKWPPSSGSLEIRQTSVSQSGGHDRG